MPRACGSLHRTAPQPRVLRSPSSAPPSGSSSSSRRASRRWSTRPARELRRQPHPSRVSGSTRASTPAARAAGAKRSPHHLRRERHDAVVRRRARGGPERPEGAGDDVRPGAQPGERPKRLDQLHPGGVELRRHLEAEPPPGRGHVGGVPTTRATWPSAAVATSRPSGAPEGAGLAASRPSLASPARLVQKHVGASHCPSSIHRGSSLRRVRRPRHLALGRAAAGGGVQSIANVA